MPVRKRKKPKTYRDNNSQATFKKPTLDFSKFMNPTSPRIWSSLNQSQKKYVKHEMDKSKKVFVTRKEFDTLPSDRQQEYINSMEDILSGKKYRNNLNQTIDNYIAGLEWNGELVAAKKLKSLKKKLSENDMELFLNEAPDLYMWYKDKASTHRKRIQDYSEETAAEQLIDVIDKLEKYYKMTKKQKEKQEQEEEEQDE